MNVLLIGGTGVLSTAVTNEALRNGIHITMINRGKRKKYIPQGVELIKADKDDKNTISKHLRGRRFDAVMDFLCYTDAQTAESYKFYAQYTKQYFYISSCAVYDTRIDKLMTEDSPKGRPEWPYSLNKWASEQKLMQLVQDSDVHYTVIRPCVTYGDTRIPYGISPRYGYHWTLAARILAGKPIIRWNGGENCCNMTRVEDFAVGVVGLIGNSKAYNEAFNVCGNEIPTFNDVLDAMAEYLGVKPVIFDISSEEYAKEIPSRAGEILGGRGVNRKMSNQKLKDVVPAFHPSISLKEGVRMTLDAYKNQGYQYGIDWDFDGDTDRIIAKYSKIRGTQKPNLPYTDYLGNATPDDKLHYYMARYKDNYLMKVSTLVYRALRKIQRIVNIK
jgi:nucleoside-diphosphate-sugar epimerase